MFLPVRAGFRGDDYFGKVINKFLCAYYTNSLINISLQSTEKDFYKDTRAEWTPYMRGFVYLLLVDVSLREPLASLQKENAIDNIFISITTGN